MVFWIDFSSWTSHCTQHIYPRPDFHSAFCTFILHNVVLVFFGAWGALIIIVIKFIINYFAPHFEWSQAIWLWISIVSRLWNLWNSPPQFHVCPLYDDVFLSNFCSIFHQPWYISLYSWKQRRWIVLSCSQIKPMHQSMLPVWWVVVHPTSWQIGGEEVIKR